METLKILFNREGNSPSGVATFCRLIVEKDPTFCLIEPKGEKETPSTEGNRIEVPAHIFCRGRKLAVFLWQKLKDTFPGKRIIFFPNVGDECYIASICLVDTIQRRLNHKACIVGICHSFDQNQFNHLQTYSPYLASIASVSHKIFSKLKELKLSPPLCSLNYPVAEHFFTIGRERKSRTENNAIRLIYVGRLELKQKRVDRLAKLIKILHEKSVAFTLTIVGDGPERSVLEKELIKSEYQEKVLFTGALSNDRIPRFLAQADIQLLVSDYEGNPISILEGMATGICPVVMEMESSWEHIRNNENGFIASAGNTQALAEIVQFLEKHRKFIWKTGQAAKESVKEFSIVKCRSQIDKQIERLFTKPIYLDQLSPSPTERVLQDCINMVKPNGASRIGVYGAGHLGLALVAEMSEEENQIPISIWVDKSESKIGSKIMGYQIAQPKKLSSSELDLLIIASVDYAQEIQSFVEKIFDDSQKRLPKILSFAKLISKYESPIAK